MTDWRDQATCRQADPDLFFPQVGAHPAEIDVARSICRNCPVQTPCLEYAIRHDTHGIWAGTSPKQRQRIRSQKQIPLVSDSERAQLRRDVTRLLNSQREASAADIAGQLGISPRTVIRVRALLRDAS